MTERLAGHRKSVSSFKDAAGQTHGAAEPSHGPDQVQGGRAFFLISLDIGNLFGTDLIRFHTDLIS